MNKKLYRVSIKETNRVQRKRRAAMAYGQAQEARGTSQRQILTQKASITA